MSPLSVKRRAGSGFPPCSSEQTCQARPEDRRRLMIIPLRMSHQLSCSERHRNTLAHFPHKPTAVRCKNKLWSVQRPSIVGNRPHLRNQAGEATVSLFSFSPHVSFYMSHFCFHRISQLWLWTLINTGDFIHNRRAVGECNHFSIYFVLPHFPVISNIFKSEATVVFRLLVIQAHSYSGYCICSVLQLQNEGSGILFQQVFDQISL